jgi:hypothetical protein
MSEPESGRWRGVRGLVALQAGVVACLTAVGRRSGSTQRFHGGCLYLVDLQDRYLALRAARGDDNAAGLRLAERLVRAGLELVEFRGRYVIRELSPGLRSPGWAAREAMVAAGVASSEDLRRWERAFEATARRPATFFAPMSPPFAAVRPISTCAPEASSSPPQPHPISHSPAPTTPTPDSTQGPFTQHQPTPRWIQA